MKHTSVLEREGPLILRHFGMLLPRNGRKYHLGMQCSGKGRLFTLTVRVHVHMYIAANIKVYDCAVLCIARLTIILQV